MYLDDACVSKCQSTFQCNILINGEGHAVITDFGLAKVKGEMSEISDKPSSMLAG